MPHALTVRGGRVVLEDHVVVADIGIDAGGRIVEIIEHDDQSLPPSRQQRRRQRLLAPGTVDIDAHGLVVAPGGVDSHCHIEQRTSTGLTPCDDFHTASVSALWCGACPASMLMLI
eukprot:COSAG01_NODE_12695_length_1698_cov_7.378361_3_plen_116_part_00